MLRYYSCQLSTIIFIKREIIMKFSTYDLRIFSAFCLVANESNTPNQVTISKIAQKLDITRQAIYKSHYSNVDEIIHALHLYIEEDIHSSFTKQISNSNSSFNCIEFIANDIVPKLYDKREYLSVLYGNKIDTTWQEFLTKRYTSALNQLLEINKNPYSSQYSEYIVAQALSIIGVWMKSKQPEHPIYFSKRFIFLMEHSISEILYNC